MFYSIFFLSLGEECFSDYSQTIQSALMTLTPGMQSCLVLRRSKRSKLRPSLVFVTHPQLRWGCGRGTSIFLSPSSPLPTWFSSLMAHVWSTGIPDWKILGVPDNPSTATSPQLTQGSNQSFSHCSDSGPVCRQAPWLPFKLQEKASG